MITDRELAEHRADALSRMKSRVTVRRKTGETVPNAEGFEVPEWIDVHVALPFRLGGANAGSSGTRTITIGDSSFQVAVRTGHMPHDTTDLLDGDHIEVTSGENVGLVLTIVEATWQDQATARRVPVHEVGRPAEWA